MFNKILKQIHKKLLNKEKTISVAESCSGGQLCSLLTSSAGSSDYFLLGVVTYSNKSKAIILNIPAKTITRYGAVSRQVAILMAQNIRKKASADFGLSITGIAGPGGATTTKPVGTVFIALASKNKTLCRLFLLHGKREAIRNKSTQKALYLLKKGLETRGRFS
jgi:nicotinamide-nucleotide amidase